MRSLFRYFLLPFTVGVSLLGCGKSETTPPPPTDVTLNVPAMN